MMWVNRLINALAILIFITAATISYKEIPVWKLFLAKDFSSLDWSILLIKDREPLGQVIKFQGTGLKRKFKDESYFNSLKNHEEVYGGDIVSTDDNSSATIKFSDGSELEIAPQSMVKIDFHAEKEGFLKIVKNPKVEVFSGSVKGVGGQNSLKLSSINGEKLTVDAYSVNVLQANKPKQSQPVKISAAQVQRLQLPPPPVVPQAIPVNQIPPSSSPPAVAQQAHPTMTSQAQVAPMEVVPKDPPRKVASIPPHRPLLMGRLETTPAKIAGMTNLANNTYQGEDLRNFFVDLKWEEDPSATAYNLELFLDSELKKPWFNVKTGNNYYRLTRMFNGTVYYRVQALHNHKVISETKSTALAFKYQGPELKNPKNKSLLQASEGVYYFTWEKTTFTDKYVIEISKDAAFQKVVKKEVENNFVQLPLIGGTYYWRVRAKQGEILSTPSSVNMVVIK